MLLPVVGAHAAFLQQGETITAAPGLQGIGAQFGHSVALSADGNTMLVGGPAEDTYGGAAWVFTRSGSTWTEQTKLTVSELSCGGHYCGAAYMGSSVALSADGNTALIGGYGNDGETGAVWVFTRSGATWTQQGPALTGGGEVGEGRFGSSVALSADGDTALIGAPDDYDDTGAAWVFTRSGTAWTQEGPKLVATDESKQEESQFGSSVALSADGDTALIGGPQDNDRQGAVWVFTRSDSAWTQKEPKLTGGGEVGEGRFGSSVALSADGDIALIGGPADDRGLGAVWAFTVAGSSWTQEGEKLVGGELDNYPPFGFGSTVALSADGYTALIDVDFNGNPELTSVFRRSGETWAEEGQMLAGGEFSLALSAQGETLLMGSGNGIQVYVVSPQVSSPTSVNFGSQTVGRPGSLHWIEVKDEGVAPLGPLVFSGAAQVTGVNAADFVIPSGDDLCDGETVEPGQACRIGVRFSAGAVGWRSAALSFGTNNGASMAPSVALRGTGVLPPTASIGISEEPATAGTPIEFDGGSSSAHDGSINNYVWSFGDGASAEGPAPNHTYVAPGAYSVTLTVTDSLGLTGTLTRLVTVKEAQRIEFLSTPPLSASVGGSTYAVSALAWSGSPVSFSSATPSVCSVQTSRVSFLAVGTCTIDADQSGNVEYGAAPPVQQSFAVGRGAQLITFTSGPPGSSIVGGPAYVASATASSGLPVLLSSRTPAVCSLEGMTVSFLAAGTCTIDANQEGDSNYDAAPQAQQSFTVGVAPVFTNTITSSLPLSLTPSLTLAPTSSFGLLGNPSVNARTGGITFKGSVRDPGIVSWLLSFQNGKFGVFSSSTGRCATGQIRLDGRCRTATVVFGIGSRPLPVAGSFSLTIGPSASARVALEHGHELRVTAILTFKSSQGVGYTSNTRWVTVGLEKHKRD
jgi:PKD repeat protein